LLFFLSIFFKYRLSVGAPSKISIACPNVARWYSIYRPLFKNSNVSKRATTTTAVLTKSSVSQLGTVIGLLLFYLFFL